MSKRTRRTFSTEFRLESAQLVVGQNYSIREAATAVGVGHLTMAQMVKKFDVQQAQITQWKKQLLNNATTAFDSNDKSSEDAEKTVDKLHAKIGQR